MTYRVFGTNDVQPLIPEASRYLSTEEGIRAELNTWAAWVESTGDGPIQQRLMQHLISTRQIFVLHDAPPELAIPVCQHLARVTEGVYQVDGQGFFDADGRLLVAEEGDDGEG